MSADLWSVDPILIEAQQAGVVAMEEVTALDDLAAEDAADLPDNLFDALQRVAEWFERCGRHLH